MTEEYTHEDVQQLLHGRSNWGRWGDDDELGTINLITNEKRREAGALVRSGRSVSLSRPFPTTPGPDNPRPAQHYMTRTPRGIGGHSGDYYGIQYHGLTSTHIDALAHVWDDRAMWNGRNPDEHITINGATWGSIDQWADGIVTRGVLLDVAAHRGDYVRHETPVHGTELEEITKSQGTEVGPGDALVVYSGRDQWDRENPPWGSELTDKNETRRPGLHASCLEFLRDNDVAIIAWDMQDCMPNPWGIPWTVHGAIFAYGMPIVDNCDLSTAAAVCKEENAHEFMFSVAPLVVAGGTGSPVNPLCIF